MLEPLDSSEEVGEAPFLTGLDSGEEDVLFFLFLLFYLSMLELDLLLDNFHEGYFTLSFWVLLLSIDEFDESESFFPFQTEEEDLEERGFLAGFFLSVLELSEDDRGESFQA